MSFKDLKDYLYLNWGSLYASIKNGDFSCNIVEQSEILSKNGKIRRISHFTQLDRLIAKVISLSLSEILEDWLCDNCYAFRKNKGVLEALQKMMFYVEAENEYILEIDIKDYFSSIEHSLLEEKIEALPIEMQIKQIIKTFYTCSVRFDYEIKQNSCGILTGSSLSPALANLFLADVDKTLNDLCYLRYCDNIYILTKDKNSADVLYKDLKNELISSYHIHINEKKSGVYSVYKKDILGYRIQKEKAANGNIRYFITKSMKDHYYTYWKKSQIDVFYNHYYLIHDGILNRKDYSLLYDDGTKKVKLPLETIHDFSMYSYMIFHSNFFCVMNDHRIPITFFNTYGQYIGCFTPAKSQKSADTFLKQAAIYLDSEQRLFYAKKIICTAVRNMIAVLQYYKKQKRDTMLIEIINRLHESNERLKKVENIEALLLEEARARENYYHAYSSMIYHEVFVFEKRTKRPPKNPVNAMISFLNTLLYKELATLIHQISLDIRISFIHSSKRRNANLNLDLSEIFKPVIIDRIIFSLINKHMIDAKLHFHDVEKNGVYLNNEGKYLIIKAYERKLNQRTDYHGQSLTYHQIMRKEVWCLLHAVQDHTTYSPWRYHL